MKLRNAMLTLAAAVALAASLADAQTRRTPAQSAQYEISSQIAEAMRYLSMDPGRSLHMLRRLNEQYPGQERVLTQTGYVLQVMGKADSAETYYKEALDVNPRSVEAGKSLGMLYISQDRDDDAMFVFGELLKRNDNSMIAYRAVGNALRDVGRYDRALEIYTRGREQGPRHEVLSLEIASLHRTMGNHEDALAAYLEYVGDQARNYRYAKARILELMRGAGDRRDTLVQLLEARLDRGAGNRFVLLDLLATHFVERGLLEQALEKALAADAEQASGGDVLLSLSERILVQAEVKPRGERRRYLELGVRALDAFTRNHPRAPGTDRAIYMLGQIYTAFGSGLVQGVAPAERVDYLERAVTEYAGISKRYPNSDYAELAYLERGDVLLYHLKRPEAALDAYKSGAVNSRRYGDVFAGRIGDLYLGTGRLDDARHYFEGLMESGVPELAQAGVYYTGLRLCLTGDYATARDTLTYLAEEVPSSSLTNDAIEIAWVVEEGLQRESGSLDTWFEVLKAEMVGDTTAVLSGLRRIASKPVYETLRPRAMHKLGIVLAHKGDLDGAVAVFKRFLEEYPEEDLRPDVQREIAHVYEFGFEEYGRALREYEFVLVNYPDYAFLDEVRDDIRRLRYIVHGEEYEN